MTNKQKVTVSLIASILILIILGLSLTIVLVASSAKVGGSMNLMYVANNVACTITPSANIVNLENGVIGVYVEPSFLKVTPSNSPNTSNNGEVVENTHNAGSIEFSAVELDAGWKVIYKINIKNDASEGGGSIIAEYMFANVDFSEQNVVVKIGSSEESAEEFAEGADLVYTTGAIAAQKEENIVIVISILNYFKKVDLEMSNFLTISMV